jgi:hypothetical protein
VRKGKWTTKNYYRNNHKCHPNPYCYMYTGPETTLGIYAKVSRRWPGAGQASNKRKTGCPFVATVRLRAFLKYPLLKELGNYSTWADCSQEQCHWKRHLSKLRLVHSPGCDRCKQASEMVSHVLYDCEALVELRFGHLVCHLLKPGDFVNTSVRKVLHCL